MSEYDEVIGQPIGRLPGLDDFENLGPTNQALLNVKWLTEENEALKDKIEKINQWCDAYPVSIFPEPDFKKAASVLKENGMTLDAISASNMRHVLTGIKQLLEAK